MEQEVAYQIALDIIETIVPKLIRRVKLRLIDAIAVALMDAADNAHDEEG